MNSRVERRRLAANMRKQSLAWPEHLVALPESEWSHVSLTVMPVAVWRSRYYFVTRYPAPSVQGAEVRRLTVNRVTIGNDGGWQTDISWDDLQRCKRETGHGDWYAVEVYPRDRDIVHVANMRHLWLLSEPIAIGWVSP